MSNSKAKENPDPGLIVCPHCDVPVLIAELNCRIFRHGVLKSTGAQISPHESKVECERLFNEGLIWGCGKPFYVKGDFGSLDLKSEICDYI